MTTGPSESSSNSAPPSNPTVLDGGTGKLGGVVWDDKKLELGGGQASGPEMTLEQLEYTKKRLGLEKFHIGNAVGEGYKLRMEQEKANNAGPPVDGSVRVLSHSCYTCPGKSN
jgi:hypothetical protein